MRESGTGWVEAERVTSTKREAGVAAATGFRTVGTATRGHGVQVAGQREAPPAVPASSNRAVEGLRVREPAATAEPLQCGAAQTCFAGGNPLDWEWS